MPLTKADKYRARNKYLRLGIFHLRKSIASGYSLGKQASLSAVMVIDRPCVSQYQVHQLRAVIMLISTSRVIESALIVQFAQMFPVFA